MSSTYIRYPSTSGGASQNVPTYANLAAFPSSPADGAAGIALDTGYLYVYHQAGSAWVLQQPGPLTSDVTTSGAAATVAQVGGVSAASVASGANLANAATNANTANAIVKRDGTGNVTVNEVYAAGMDSPSAGGSLSIGTTNATTVNIGSPGATVNIQGATTNIQATNTDVTDQLMTLNHGGTTGSGAGVGIEVEEAGSITGYQKVSSDRNSWTFKAPNTAGVASLTPGASNDTVALLAATQTLTNKTISGASNTLTNIPNTATTAASANTASAIVTRDSSGNFSASTITAALSGNATSATTATSATSAGSVSGTNVVTNANLAQMAASTLKGNAGGSTANAADLTAAQVNAILNPLVIQSKSSAYTVLSTDRLMIGNATSAAFTFTLPTGSTVSGIPLRFKKSDSDATFNAITITDGTFTTTLNTSGESVCVMYTGTAYELIDRRIPQTWTTYTLTIGATTTAPTPGTNTQSAQWRREGDSMRIRYVFTQTVAGTAGNGDYLFPLPSGPTIDTAKCNVATTGNGQGGSAVGVGAAAGTTGANAQNSVDGAVIPYNTTNVRLITTASTTIDETCPVGSTWLGINGAAQWYTFEALLPISGWKG